MDTNIATYSQPVGRERIVMPGNGSALRLAAPSVSFVQDTCVLIAGPSVGFAHRTAMTDAGTVAFAGTPAWSPPI